MLYDILIIGGGPAGLTAALFACRAGKKVVIIERTFIGGQIAPVLNVENIPGFISVNGADFSNIMHEQVKRLGAETVFADVLKYDIKDKIKTVETTKGTYSGKTIILAMGASNKQLNLDGEKKFIGRGISYCASCDGNFFKGKNVAVVGGGNSSVEDALYLADVAEKVFLIHRRDEFRADKISVNKIYSLADSGKIELVLNAEIIEIKGNEKLEGLKVKNKLTEKINDLQVSALFVAVGRKPDTDMLADLVNLDENGYILANQNMETNIPGVYAAGDVVKKKLRQIVTACSDGAIAAVMINEYLNKLK